MLVAELSTTVLRLQVFGSLFDLPLQPYLALWPLPASASRLVRGHGLLLSFVSPQPDLTLASCSTLSVPLHTSTTNARNRSLHRLDRIVSPLSIRQTRPPLEVITLPLLLEPLWNPKLSSPPRKLNNKPATRGGYVGVVPHILRPLWITPRFA
ncbi:hypothetical protein CEP53_010078 [Fusarium sp. AF-6]|nr:hypothetical protein CEP53_010078 [Fusarium sp. AF-6]